MGHQPGTGAEHSGQPPESSGIRQRAAPLVSAAVGPRPRTNPAHSPPADWGGPRRILGAVTDPSALRRLLVALGLAAEPPPRAGAAVAATPYADRPSRPVPGLGAGPGLRGRHAARSPRPFLRPPLPPPTPLWPSLGLRYARVTPGGDHPRGAVL